MNNHVGKQLGNYRLVQLLGQGGFADVYLGEQIYLKTLAAIKILQTRLAQDDLEVFLKEARTISNLIHPHIVRVLEFGVEGTTPFLVMDFAPNGTLRQRHPRGTRLSPVDIVPYVKQVASALQYAHDKKFIHRDIKPENMLIGQNNEVLLSDFGIALVAQSSRYQNTQEVVGTIAYMAPEQFHGKAVAASDQYSLGIVVYEWLTGDRPFQGSFAEVASQHLLTPPTPLHEKTEDITPAIEEVVQRAIAKDPQQRFPRVEAFANAFEQACLPTAKQMPFVALPPNSPMANYGPVPPGQFSSIGNIPKPSSPGYPPVQNGGVTESTFVKPQGQGSPPNYSSPSGQYQPYVSSNSQSSQMPEQPKRSTSRRGVIVALAGVAGLVVVGSAATLFELSQKGAGSTPGVASASSTTSANSNSTVGTSPTAVPTDTSTSDSASTTPTVDTTATTNPFPTVAATPGATVYSADWSSGMNGWAGSTDWKVLNGSLLNDGTNGNVSAGQTITPPYQLYGISDYALETTIQVISNSYGYNPQFGFALRGSTVSNSWQGYEVGIGILNAGNYGGTCNVQITTEDTNNQLIKTPFDPGKSKHTYRFEAKGNLLRFFIDGGNVLEVNDNRYLTGSQLGLWCYQTQLNITSFKIITL